MPYDGIVTSAVVSELNALIVGGKIEKVFQAERDEIVLAVHSKSENYRLLLSACSSNPRMHFTKQKKENPIVALQFCMVLRKHIQGGKILEIKQQGYDRIVEIKIETYNEMGDLVTKTLVIEIMGKHSNIILLGPTGIIYDSIKHIDNSISSVREVMPTRPYQLPPAQNKLNPADLDIEELIKRAETNIVVVTKPLIRTDKYLLETLSGFSPLLCKEICLNSDIDLSIAVTELNLGEQNKLIEELGNVSSLIKNKGYTPTLIYSDDAEANPVDFHCLKIKHQPRVKYYNNMNILLDDFYTTRDNIERLKQKKSSVAKNLSVALDRCKRKMLLQEDTLREAADFNDFRVKGDLIIANLYKLKDGDNEIWVDNYYIDPPQQIKIELESNISPQKNAQLLFKKYHKLKSSYENAQIHLCDTKEEFDYLASVEQLLDNCSNSIEIQEIRQELTEQGYIKFGVEKAKKKPKTSTVISAPFKFITDEGIEIFVGKNNKQNDKLTLHTARNNDIWLHAKNVPGSHVIISTVNYTDEISDEVIEKAAQLAAWYSSAKSSSNVLVDYTRVKNVKKPSGARPGMVNYINYKTINVKPSQRINADTTSSKQS